MILCLQVNAFLGHLCVTLAIAVVLAMTVEMPMARIWKIILEALGLGDRGTVKPTVKQDVDLQVITTATPTVETDATELSRKHENTDGTVIS